MNAPSSGERCRIIATEKGWNLYFGGNGGMKPRHGDSFAADLDEETLIHYIDRFMMFYIRTADKLQRTSVWLSLEGALNIYGGHYSRQVRLKCTVRKKSLKFTRARSL